MFATRNACIFNFTDCIHGRIIDPPVNDNRGDEKSSFGLLQCLYEYYYDFFEENDDPNLKSLKIFNRDWSGYLFSFKDE